MSNTTITQFKCFVDNAELGQAVRDYVMDPSDSSVVALTYGHPPNTWCVDEVTSFQGIFKGQTSFNDDLDMWETSQVTTFQSCFEDVQAMTGNISTWDTSGATDMSLMVSLHCISLHLSVLFATTYTLSSYTVRWSIVLCRRHFGLGCVQRRRF